MAIQLRPRVCMIPVNHVPKSGGGTHETRYLTDTFSPIDEEHDAYAWQLGVLEEANGDPEIVFTLRAGLAGTPGRMTAEIAGGNGTIVLGECPGNPGEWFVTSTGCTAAPAPDCPDEPMVIRLHVDKLLWNQTLANSPATMNMHFYFPFWPSDCDDSFITVDLTYSVYVETSIVYTAPASRRFRTFKPVLTNSTSSAAPYSGPRYKWGTRRWSPRTGARVIEVVSETRDLNSEDDEHDMVSLASRRSGPHEENSIAPGKCATVYPCRLHRRGCIVRVTGVGDCIHW